MLTVTTTEYTDESYETGSWVTITYQRGVHTIVVERSGRVHVRRPGWQYRAKPRSRGRSPDYAIVLGEVLVS